MTEYVLVFFDDPGDSLWAGVPWSLEVFPLAKADYIHLLMPVLGRQLEVVANAIIILDKDLRLTRLFNISQKP